MPSFLSVDSHSIKLCYTSRAFDCCQLSGQDFQEGLPTCDPH